MQTAKAKLETLTDSANTHGSPSKCQLFGWKTPKGLVWKVGLGHAASTVSQ